MRAGSHKQSERRQLARAFFALDNKHRLTWPGDQFRQPKQRQLARWIFDDPAGTIWRERAKVLFVGVIKSHNNEMFIAAAIVVRVAPCGAHLNLSFYNRNRVIKCPKCRCRSRFRYRLRDAI